MKNYTTPRVYAVITDNYGVETLDEFGGGVYDDAPEFAESHPDVIYFEYVPPVKTVEVVVAVDVREDYDITEWWQNDEKGLLEFLGASGDIVRVLS